MVAIGIVLSNILSISFPPNSTIIRFGIGYLPLIIISIVLGPKIGLFSAIVQDILGYFIYLLIYGYVSGPFFPGFTFNAILYGVIPGLIYNLKLSKFNLFRYINLGLMIVLLGMAIWGLIDIKGVISIIEGRLTDDMIFNEWVVYLIIITGAVGVLAILVYLIRQRNETDKAQRIIFSVIILQLVISLFLTPLWVSILYHIPFWPQLPLRIFKTPVEIFIYSILLVRLIKIFKSDYAINQ